MAKNHNYRSSFSSKNSTGDTRMTDATEAVNEENLTPISEENLKDPSSVFENSKLSDTEVSPAHEVLEEPVLEASGEPTPEVVDEPIMELAPQPEQPVIEELTVSTQPPAEESLSTLVNPAQNFTSDASIKAWETNSKLNIIRPILENVFNEYEKNMRPKKPIDRNKGGEYQATMYQTIVRVAQTRAFFNENWEYILSRFQENPNNVYGINYVMRFVDKMKVTKADTVLYPKLLNLIIMTCDKEKMVENLRRVSLEKTLSTVASGTMRGNILGYYRQFVA